MSHKLFRLFSLVMIAVLLLTACAPATTPTATEPPAEEQPTQPPAEEPTKPPAAEPTKAPEKKVVITWWHISTAEEHKALWQTFADEYMAAHPNVDIQITVLENEAFKSKMTTVMQSGTPPDIFQSWGGGVMIEYAKAGLLRDITPELDANGGEWRNTFSPGALGVYAFEGRNYGVPWDMGMVGFWYNKALFAQAGIEKPPATWTELLEDVKKLKAAGITPIALGAGDKWPAMFWWAYLAVRLGGKDAFEAAYSRQGSFTDAPFVEAGKKLQELIALEPFQEGYLGATYGDQATLMGNGKAAMELMGQWAPSVQKDNSADKQGIGDNLGWFPFPMVEGGKGDPDDAFGGGNGFAIGKNATPEAIDFVKYLTSVDCQVRLAKINVALPVVKGGEAGVSDPLLLAVQQGAAKAKYFQLYYDQALPPAVGSVVNDSVQGLFAGTLTPEQVAQAIEDSAAMELK
ncbi:extracellular solute-binding protein [Anaerolinea thermophila]|uniref:ABC transporter substrate binding protein n=1 Tax=Anaerolinea thermophila (strain DSM 14523 / JCM 11388 / NBRC 100420 / UNI-1) TaxID=926569 RepID=E8N1E3_ANATU|nr:extracellular solute-binding protein [Anaerolinea thermophila]BAJ64886.1 putative ABC transporter substrate binding protein [Anaerolinea thermophila UNI-1]